MKSLVRSIKVLMVMLGLTVFTVSLVHGKPEYSKKEGKACIACHVKASSKELNDVGKCYKEKKSLKDCGEPAKAADKKAKKP